MGPLEQRIEEILRYHLSSLPAVQNAFRAGRLTPTYDDLASDTALDALQEEIEILQAAVQGLREAVIAVARELDDPAST